MLESSVMGEKERERERDGGGAERRDRKPENGVTRFKTLKPN
jgi:hypothetical protein